MQSAIVLLMYGRVLLLGQPWLANGVSHVTM